MGDDSVEMIGDEGAAGASGIVLVDPEPEAEHEVVDEQLGAAVEEFSQRLPPIVRLEDVLLLDRDPGQLLAPAGKLVATPHQRLLGLEELKPRRKPFLTRSDLVISQCSLLLAVTTACPCRPTDDVSHRRREYGNRRGARMIRIPDRGHVRFS